MSELRLVSPADGARLIGPFDASCEQQVQGTPPSGIAFGQFSNSAAGPWQDCRNDAGAVETLYPNGYPWSAQEITLTFPGFALNEDAHFRIVVRGENGDFLASNSVSLKKTSASPAEEPKAVSNG